MGCRECSKGVLMNKDVRRWEDQTLLLTINQPKHFGGSDLTKSKPSRKLTYPTWGKGKSSLNMPYQGGYVNSLEGNIFSNGLKPANWFCLSGNKLPLAARYWDFWILGSYPWVVPVSWQPRKNPFQSVDVCPTAKWRIPMFNPILSPIRLRISCMSRCVNRKEYSGKLPSKLAGGVSPWSQKITGLCRSSSKDVYRYIYMFQSVKLPSKQNKQAKLFTRNKYFTSAMQQTMIHKSLSTWPVFSY